MQYRSQSSSSTASMASSPSYSRGGWAPAQATLSPAACTAVEHDYFAMKRTNSSDSTTSSTTTSSRRDSSSSSSSSVSGMVFSSSPLSPSIAYPCWPVHDTTIASPSRQGSSSIAKAVIPPPVQMPTSHITDDELAAIDFSAGRRSSNASTSSAEYDAGAQGISWSQTKQPTAPQREERRRRLPPPPPGMSTVVSGGKRKSASKERRRKGLSMIKE